MRKDWFIIIATAGVIANIYYDNILFKKLKVWKKYYQMGAVGVFGVLMFIFFRKNPNDSRKLIEYAVGTMQYLPFDRGTTQLLTPVLKCASAADAPSSRATGAPNVPGANLRTKRSVSETKKKYVASQQNWLCSGCGDILTAWFEVDHTLSLESGGTNDVSNLVAMCRNCHGKKTAMQHI